MSKKPFEDILAWAAVSNPGKKVYAIVPYAFSEKHLLAGWETTGWDNLRVKLESWARSSLPYGLVGRGYREISFEDLHPERAEFPEETVRVETTRTGLAAMWESGGATGAGGSATVIAGPGGQRKKPLFINTRGHLANGNHALLVLNKGDYIFDVQTSYGHPYKVRVLQVVGFQNEPIVDEDDLLSLLGGGPSHPEGTLFASCRLVAERRGDAWWPELPQHLQEAYAAAFKKAQAYHCRTAMYVER